MLIDLFFGRIWLPFSYSILPRVFAILLLAGGCSVFAEENVEESIDENEAAAADSTHIYYAPTGSDGVLGVDVARVPPPSSYLAPALSDDSISEQVVRVKATFVDVHSGPGRGYPIFLVLEYDETLYLLKMRTDWIKIQTRRGQQGWIHRNDMSGMVDLAGRPLNFAETAYEDYLKRRVSLGFSAGDFGGANSLSLNIGYRFTANISTEIRVTQALGEFSDSLIMQANILHQPFPNWRISPYFLLGAGQINTSPNATIIQPEDRQDAVMLVGGGLLMYASRRFVVRAEYSNHYLLTSREHNQEVEEWKLGFEVFL